ncbi:hypothetical protein [Acinetobacter brisouii]|mgnify:CR=1 FL=1|uniref:hypothetical protein n=1 Tax=Acinetobacter brisouii TaxID=396323 RepID=UPI00124F6D69|nr:hypothetical protein [Acinetobacter brisouii]
MKNHYKVLALLTCGAIVTACQNPASVQPPVTQTPVQSTTNNQNIVAYFSSMQTGGVLLTNAHNADVYRVLIKHDEHGYLVQDFFQASKQPQSSPVLLSNPADLKNVAPTSIIGDLTLYYRNGKVYQQATYNPQHQPIGRATTYTAQGKLIMQEDNRSDGSYSGQFWYPENLHLALSFEMNAKNQVTSAKGWDRQQHAIANSQCFAEKTLNPQNTNDPCYQLLMQLYQNNATLAD